jgi:hypothetical protein
MRLYLLALATFAVARISSAAPIDLGIAAACTPYDPYLSPVKRVLGTVGEDKASMDRVADLMRTGRSFRYVHSTPYLAAEPTQTASRRAGDCKDKALWLCDQLRDSSARFVIGKVKRNPKVSHAWVMWENEGRWWILDCTLSWRPIPADRVRRDDYVPLYSYSKDASYRHARTALLMVGTGKATAAVAAKSARR